MNGIYSESDQSDKHRHSFCNIFWLSEWRMISQRIGNLMGLLKTNYTCRKFWANQKRIVIFSGNSVLAKCCPIRNTVTYCAAQRCRLDFGEHPFSPGGGRGKGGLKQNINLNHSKNIMASSAGAYEHRVKPPSTEFYTFRKSWTNEQSIQRFASIAFSFFFVLLPHATIKSNFIHILHHLYRLQFQKTVLWSQNTFILYFILVMHRNFGHSTVIIIALTHILTGISGAMETMPPGNIGVTRYYIYIQIFIS